MISDQIIKDLRDNLVKQSQQNPCHIPVTITKEVLRGVSCYWVRTVQSSTQQVILYLHGGSNIMGSIETHKNLVAHIVDKTSVQALFVEYSLAPEHPFPKGLQDIVQVYEELLSRFSPKSIVVMGDSAGGQQGLALLLKLKGEEVSLPAAYVGLSPAVDITPDTLRKNIKEIKNQDPLLNNPDDIIPFLELYYTHDSPYNPFISPIYGDLTGLPPLLIQVSTTEALVFQCEDFANKAKDVGVAITLEKYENELHTWQFHNLDSVSSKKSVESIVAFVQEQLQKRPSRLFF